MMGPSAPRHAGGASPASADDQGAEAGRSLLIGYGNSLRSDDGAGWHAARLAAADARFAGVTILALHQLAPEVAAEIAEARVVVFVDADAATGPGSVTSKRLVSVPGASSSTHHVDAGSLLAMSAELFGASPPAWVVGVGPSTMELGDELSAAVAAALPAALDLALVLLDRRDQPA